MYAKNNCVFHYQLPETCTTCATGTAPTSTSPWTTACARRTTWSSSPSIRDTLQSFRLAAQGKTAGRQPPEHLRERIDTLLRSAAVLVSAARGRGDRPRSAYPLQRGHAAADGDVPLVGFAERLAAPDPQPQLPVRRTRAPRAAPASPTAAGAGSRASGARCAAWLRYSEAVEPGTVWTWNAIGKASGAWQLAPGADESRKGFLLNHLITDELPLPTAPRRDASATPIRSPARPAGTTSACACGRPRPAEAAETSPHGPAG